MNYNKFYEYSIKTCLLKEEFDDLDDYIEQIGLNDTYNILDECLFELIERDKQSSIKWILKNYFSERYNFDDELFVKAIRCNNINIARIIYDFYDINDYSIVDNLFLDCVEKQQIESMDYLYYSLQNKKETLDLAFFKSIDIDDYKSLEYLSKKNQYSDIKYRRAFNICCKKKFFKIVKWIYNKGFINLNKIKMNKFNFKVRIFLNSLKFKQKYNKNKWNHIYNFDRPYVKKWSFKYNKRYLKQKKWSDNFKDKTSRNKLWNDIYKKYE